MKRKLFIFLLFFFAYLTAAPSVFAQEKIKEFKSDVAINLDGSINVTETIIYDFDELKKHGIFRIIPTIKTNEEGKKFQLEKLSLNSYRIWSTRNLNLYEGLTFAVSFPAGIVAVLEPQEYGKLTSGQALLLGVVLVLGFSWCEQIFIRS